MRDPLPAVIVVDEAWVKVGGRKPGSTWPWIPAEGYLPRAFLREGRGDCQRFLENLVEPYREWQSL